MPKQMPLGQSASPVQGALQYPLPGPPPKIATLSLSLRHVSAPPQSASDVHGAPMLAPLPEPVDDATTTLFDEELADVVPTPPAPPVPLSPHPTASDTPATHAAPQ
jgi:hypothetical protein